MIKQPILEEKVYSNKKPKGYHTIKVWESEKEEGKAARSADRPIGLERIRVRVSRLLTVQE